MRLHVIYYSKCSVLLGSVDVVTIFHLSYAYLTLRNKQFAKWKKMSNYKKRAKSLESFLNVVHVELFHFS